MQERGNEKYVLYGAGWYAERFLYNFPSKARIDYCIDGYQEGEFHGYPIYTLEHAPDIKKHMVIVAAVWEAYKQIREYLKDLSLKEFQDFIWAEAFGKKIAVLNANCYGRIYKKYLCQSQCFTTEYILWEVPLIHFNEERCISNDLLRACDLYIHQDIRKDNRFGFQLSDEYILPQLKESCRIITVPNMVGMGKWMFPTGTSKPERQYRGGKVGPFFRDFVIDNAYEQFKSVKKIKKYILKEKPFSEKEVKDLFSDFIMKLKEREKNWDIMISDYILENYKTEKIFYDADHPGEGVMKEITKRIGVRLGINDIDGEIEYKLNMFEEFVFPYIQEALGLIYEEKYVRDRYSEFDCREMDIDEYIREYIWWFYGEYIE